MFPAVLGQLHGKNKKIGTCIYGACVFRGRIEKMLFLGAQGWPWSKQITHTYVSGITFHVKSQTANKLQNGDANTLATHLGPQTSPRIVDPSVLGPGAQNWADFELEAAIPVNVWPTSLKIPPIRRQILSSKNRFASTNMRIDLPWICWEFLWISLDFLWISWDFPWIS